MPVGAKVATKPTGIGLVRDDDAILCRSQMFVGYEYSRSLSGEGRTFTIRDFIRSGGGPAAYRTLFRIPPDKKIEIGEQAVTVWNAARSHKMTIVYPENATARIASGPDADPPSIETLDYRKARDAQTIVFEYPAAAEVHSEFLVTLD
jgi:hypothetical protein